MSEGRNTELVSSWREAMEGVSSGPWRHYRNKLRPQFGGIINEVQCRSKTPVVAWPGFEDSKRKEPKHALNAAWIARCSPSGISALLDALESTSRALSEKEGELAASRKLVERRTKERDKEAERADGNWFAYGDVIRQRDEALAALKASEEREAGLREKLCPAVDWKVKLDELYSWSGSAFLAGEKVEDEASHKPRLYGFLCGLIGYLIAGRDAAAVLENGPADLADATKKDPGTEQREVGR